MKRAALALAVALGVAALPAPSVASPRIVNGVETSGYPTVGALLYAAYGNPVTQHNALLRCSGILVGCRTFLTAAHCVGNYSLPSSFAVYLQNAGFLAVEDIHVHPDYDGDSPEHDLAIVKLAEPLEGIDPSAINSTHDLASIGTGLQGTIVGFGRIGGENYDYQYEYGIKRSGHVETASCDADVLDGLEEGSLICWDFVAPVGEPGEDSSTCHGDSGGPLFMDFAGSVELAGVTYGGTEDDCLPPSQSIQVDVFRHAAWIAGELEGDSTETCGERPPIGTALTPVHTESGWLGQSRRTRTFRVPVRDDTSRVLVTFNGSDDGDFDADLFVRRNADASFTDYDCRVFGESLFGACELAMPGEGFLSVLVVAREYAGRFQVTVVESNEEAPVCGNATLELGEDCDGGELGACPTGPCGLSCKCPAPVCGNGALEEDERCDDGNVASGDGCDASCVPETPDDCEDAPLLELTTGSWTLRGDTTGLGDSRVGCGSKAGDAWYRFSIEEAAVLSAETDGAFDSGLSLYRGDCSEYFRRDCDNDDGPGPGSSIVRRSLEAGQYVLIVDGSRGLHEGPFELRLSLTAPGCGNDVWEDSASESCDGLDKGYCDYGLCGDDCQCAPPSCGNDVREDGEACDGSDLGYCDAGPCTPDCACPEPICGNGKVEWYEECDGQSDYYCEPGTCGDDCTCDFGTCGNDVREGWESCDGTDLGSCDHGPCEGCTCPDPVCGNGLLESGEYCDGSNLGRCHEGPCAGDCTCPPTYCGNGFREYPEECDGPAIGGCDVGPCSADCECPDPVCGNDVVEYEESCDGEDARYCPTGVCGDDCECPPAVCGNGIREQSESCDGPTIDYCSYGPCEDDCTCPEPVCGNGILEASSEQCDGPDLSFCLRGPCQENCQCPSPVCGNEIREGAEECDGTALGWCPTGPCGNDCTCPDPICGNDVHEIGEDCDGTATSWCDTGSCEEDCTCTPPVCGDGVRHYPEACDGEDITYCAAGPCGDDCECPPPVCGNDVREPGESCDGPDNSYCSVDACEEDCSCPAPVCGNNVVEQGESCDGTKVGYCLLGPCDPDCSCPAPVCGNKVIEPGEKCDGTKLGTCKVGPCQGDCTCPPAVCGNLVHETGEECDGYRLGQCDRGPCQSDCTCPPAVCGDGWWDYPEEICEIGEEGYCEFGVCRDDCSCPPPTCGDGVAEGNEECDGDDVGWCDAGCDDECRCNPYCGDGYQSGNEDCDWWDEEQCPGDCRSDCTCPRPQCGDSIVQGDEQCDGGNLGDDCPVGPCQDNCRCPKPICGNGAMEDRESCEGSDQGVCGSHACDSECGCAGGLACLNATELPASPGDYDHDSTTVGATSDGVGCGGEAGDRWYRFRIARYSVFEASTDGAYDSYLTLFAGDCASLGFLDCNDDALGTNGSRIEPIRLKPGDYLLVVDGHGTDEGDFTLSIDLEPWGCGDADGNGSVTSSDALRVLRKGVGLDQVCPVVRCDAGGDGSVSASDALTVLRTAVGIAVDLYCPSGL